MDKQVVIHSPVAESSAEMTAQINDTVKMTSYQVKRKLEAEKEQELEIYNNLRNHIKEDLYPHIEETSNRIEREAREILIPQIVEKLRDIDHWFEVGETDTYFDDNRSTEVSFEMIAESIFEIQRVEFSEEHVEVHFTIGIVGVQGYANYRSSVDAEDTTFTPATQIKQFQLTDEEIGHRANLKAREAEASQANDHYNKLCKQLSNLGNLSEDIEYALLKEKHSASKTTDLVDQLTEALTSQGSISPDFLLKGK